MVELPEINYTLLYYTSSWWSTSS